MHRLPATDGRGQPRSLCRFRGTKRSARYSHRPSERALFRIPGSVAASRCLAVHTRAPSRSWPVNDAWHCHPATISSIITKRGLITLTQGRIRGWARRHKAASDRRWQRLRPRRIGGQPEQPSSQVAKQLSIGAAAARRKSSHRRGIDGGAVGLSFSRGRGTTET